ncbi:hypothetical protein AEQU1_00116 [Aequorivita sp. CIP111184]|nr:hypothetical protein AEQU1_00116 [Aequorivita sp. CIP111184]
MPNRNVEGQYRYGYQGEFAETDPETGMPAFELRLWDSRIGRWLTTDPYGQHFSPYMGMGNNPISTVDPDGGCDDPPCWENGDYNNGSLDEVVVIGQGSGGLKSVGYDYSGMPDFMRFDMDSSWTSSTNLSLSEYNQKYGTDFGDQNPGNTYNQWAYRFYYKPQYDDMISSIHEGTNKAANIILQTGLTIAPIGEIVIGSKLVYLGVTKVSKISIHGYRAFKVGDASANALRSSVYFTKTLNQYGLNIKFFAPTIYGSSKTLGTFLGRNSAVFGTGLIFDGSRRLYNLYGE